MTRVTAVAAGLLVCTSSTLADGYVLVPDPVLTFFDVDVNTSFVLDGAVVGDYDPVSNPDGTQTIADGGVNAPVSCAVSVSSSGSGPAALPQGTRLEWTPGAPTATLSGLALELEDFTVTSWASAVFEAFETVNPTASFPDGFTVPLAGPFGFTAGSIVAQQTGASTIGVASSGPGGAIVNGALQMEVVIDGSLMGQPHGVTATFLGFVTGSLDLDLDGGVESFSLTISGGIKIQPGTDVVALADTPFEIPLDNGAAASLLFSGVPSEAVSETTVIGNFFGEALPCAAADLDCSGAVDGVDVGLLLGGWGGSGPGDLDGSGTVDAADLGLLLGAWG